MPVQLSTPLPPKDLIFLVNGHYDTRLFGLSRVDTPNNIIALLSEAGFDFRRFTSILDYGCGCGRILAGWEPHLRPGLMLNGVDINHRLVSFCKTNIPFARTEVCGCMPPLPYFSDDQFDFVYAASIFTHRSLEAAHAWAREMRRIIRPGGVLMVSFHGSWYLPALRDISATGVETLEREGYFVHLHGEAHQTWEGSNQYATFMTAAFAKSLFQGFELAKNFTGEERGPNPFASYQDISVFQRSHDAITERSVLYHAGARS